MTSKFKVGDMVIFNEANKNVAEDFGYNPNKAYEIKNAFLLHGTIQLINEHGMTHSFDVERFLLAEPKQTKNQRITALENEVAELRPLKDTVTELQKQLEQMGVVVEKIRKPSTVVQESLTIATSSVEGKAQSEGERLVKQCEQHFSPVEESPNEKRAEIIEKAKMFIENAIERGRYGDSPNVDNGHEYYREHYFDVDFCVKNNKVTALVFLNDCVGERFENKPALIGRSSCAPDDVFNKYIGMAIALGRALGLDVSEFEQAVQPTNYAIGQIVQRHDEPIDSKYKYVVDKIGRGETLTKLFDDGKAHCNTTLPLSYDNGIIKSLKIIDDTNAIYGGGE